MSANEERKKAQKESGSGSGAQGRSGGRRREKAIYVDVKTGAELFVDEDMDSYEEDAEELEEDVPDLEPVDDDDGAEEDGEEELDSTPVDLAWASLGFHDDSVFSVKMRVTADGKIILASGGGDEVGYLAEIGDGVAPPDQGAIFKFEGHSDSVSRVAFSHDGKLLATAGLDAIVSIWDVSDGTLVTKLEGPSESIETIEWHAKGPVLLAGCGDGTAWMWDASPKGNGAVLNVFGGHGNAVNAAKFTPDGTKIVTVGEDASLRVWGPKTGKQLAIVQGHGFHEAGINCLAIHADNNLALTGGQDNNACLVNLSTAKPKSMLQGHTDSVEEVAWVTGNPWAVTGSLDCKIGVWDLNTGHNRQWIENGNAGITSLQMIGDVIYTADTLGYIRLWDVRSSSNIQTIRASQDPILAFDVLASHKLIATAGDDALIKLYKLQI